MSNSTRPPTSSTLSVSTSSTSNTANTTSSHNSTEAASLPTTSFHKQASAPANPKVGSTAEDETTSSTSTSIHDDIATIVTEAHRNAQSELRSTSEILKLAGAVLQRGSGNGNDYSSSAMHVSLGSTGVSGFASSPGNSPIKVASLSDEEDNLSNGGIYSIPEYSHLPGKFHSLSLNESAELINSPAIRTIFLSKLDGLKGLATKRIGSSGSSVTSSQSAESSGEGNVMANMATARAHASASMSGNSSVLSAATSITTTSQTTNIRSKSDVTAAMENAMAHANRIKTNQYRRGSSSSNLPLNGLTNNAVIDQSEMSRLPHASHFEMMPLWVQRKIAAESGFTNGVGSNNSSPNSKKERRSDANNKDDEDEGKFYHGQYTIHPSETIITHEFNRGDWTWITEWSPDGKHLALATENHNLAIIEAGITTPVWKVIQDDRIGRLKNDTTHTIRSIAWGGSFIALGGTGDAVSIVEPCITSDASASSNSASKAASKATKKEHFRIVDVITETGFVGTLHWQKNSNILAIGNREDQCLVVEVCKNKETGAVSSNILHNIERADWVNAVKFSPGGTKLAIGDRSGLLSVFSFVVVQNGEPPALSPLQDILMDDNILDIQWSPDAKFIYAGGEDYCVTVFGTQKWDVLQRIGRDRWVPFLAPSRGGSYLAVGGGTSSVSLLDVKQQWEEITELPLEGGIPLCAKWHPKDQYLAISGQLKNVVVYETSCRRLPKGMCLRSKSTVLAVEFSPNGKIIAVGNESGLVTFFDATSTAFVTLFETVIGVGKDITIQWSSSGRNVAIASGSTFVLFDTIFCGKVGVHPASSSRFLVRKVIQGGVNFTSLAFSPKGDYIALTDDQTRILNIKDDCSCVRVLDQQNVLSSGWSPDGAAFALVGKRDNLSIYDSRSSSKEWKLLFSIAVSETVLSLCWGPSVKKGLHYLAFAGEDRKVTILEVRTYERTWETVIEIPCASNINDLDWSDRGMICIGDDEGTVSVVDLSYLKSGRAVNEMNYNWQRQGVICTMKLTRNLGRNAITSLRWHQSTMIHNNRTLLAIGGSDGIVEVVDLSERSKLES
jgi:WD40 repeat protein